MKHISGFIPKLGAECRIEYISTFATLSAGDVIITGSPGGVGKKRTPPLFMQEGDVIEVEIQKIGKLRNQIVSDARN